jgi:hypothetical protein
MHSVGELFCRELETLAWEQNEGDGVLCWTNDAASSCSVFFLLLALFPGLLLFVPTLYNLCIFFPSSSCSFVSSLLLASF